MESSLPSDAEFTRSTHHSLDPSAEQPSSVTALATFGFTCLLTQATRLCCEIEGANFRLRPMHVRNRCSDSAFGFLTNFGCSEPRTGGSRRNWYVETKNPRRLNVRTWDLVTWPTYASAIKNAAPTGNGRSTLRRTNGLGSVSSIHRDQIPPEQPVLQGW
jgi:hypothetical protein